VGRVSVCDSTHLGRVTGQQLNSLSIFDPVGSSVLNTVFGESGKDMGIGIAERGLLGGVWVDRDLENNMFVQDVLAICIRDGEADRQHFRDANAISLILE
jgi:hypothetical protein